MHLLIYADRQNAIYLFTYFVFKNILSSTSSIYNTFHILTSCKRFRQLRKYLYNVRIPWRYEYLLQEYKKAVLSEGCTKLNHYVGTLNIGFHCCIKLPTYLHSCCTMPLLEISKLSRLIYRWFLSTQTTNRSRFTSSRGNDLHAFRFYTPFSSIYSSVGEGKEVEL